MNMAEDRTLPGMPKKKLVTGVRRALRTYGIRPNSQRLWLETWQWARQIKDSYVYPSWPIPSEIAAQYMFLLLCEMREHHALKLPHRAAEQQPPAVKARLASLATGRALTQAFEQPKTLPAHELSEPTSTPSLFDQESDHARP